MRGPPNGSVPYGLRLIKIPPSEEECNGLAPDSVFELKVCTHSEALGKAGDAEINVCYRHFNVET